MRRLWGGGFFGEPRAAYAHVQHLRAKIEPDPKNPRYVLTMRAKSTTGPSHHLSVRWEEDLPPGYRLREDPDLLILLRPDGSEVAAFSALGADPLEMIAAAWEDHE